MVIMHQVSNSSTFYSKLLLAQSQKHEKKIDSLTAFFALLGSMHVKALHKMLAKLTPWLHEPQSRLGIVPRANEEIVTEARSLKIKSN
jgi:hypothetical protein